MDKQFNFVDEGVEELIEGLPVVHRYKYLGVYFDDTMRPYPHLFYLAKKLSKF